MKMRILVVIFAFIFISMSFAGAQVSSAGSVNYQKQADFQTYYSSSDMNTYWPVLSNKEDCQARQDIILNVAPAGCQPAVVRSDLLADQNVPVFCQIDALQINPLIDIKQIKNIRFSGTYPKEVVGTGFHPAQAALRTRDVLLGSPLINNIGYVVVILKRTPNETGLPDFVTVNLSAQLEYDAGNAIGIGRTEFILEKPSAAEAEIEKIKNSFWGGRYSLKLEEADANYATVSLYDGDAKITTTQVKKGAISKEIYLPGSYCMVALQLEYSGFESAQKKATIEVTTDKGTDAFDVYKGSSFLNGKCSVTQLEFTSSNNVGNVTLNCGGKSFRLDLKPVAQEGLGVTIIANDYIGDGEGIIKKVLPENKVTIEVGGNVVMNEGKEREFKAGEYKPKTLADEEFSADSQKNMEARKMFEQVIAAYDIVAEDYPQEKNNVLGETVQFNYGTYGEEALARAKDFAGSYNQIATKEKLLQKLISLYPTSSKLPEYQAELANIYTLDFASSTASLDINGRYSSVRLVRMRDPKNKAGATFFVDNQQITVNEKESKQQGAVQINLNKVYVDKADVSVLCYSKDGWKKESDITITTSEGSRRICGEKSTLKLSQTNLEEAARIRVLPKSSGSGTQTNLTVRIGIEKRAIQLSPDRTKERIKNINESIAKWESISERLGKVVKGLKSACLATSLALTVKNFMSGIGGTTMARQQAMSGPSGWKVRCQNAINDGSIDRNGDGAGDASVNYKTLTQCFNEEKNYIESDITARKNAISTVNSEIAQAEQGTKSGNLITGEKVDEKTARNNYLQILQTKYANDPAKSATLARLGEQIDTNGNAPFSYTDLRDLDYNWELQKTSSLSAGATRQAEAITKKIDDSNAALQSAMTQGKAINANPTPIGLLTNPKVASVEVFDIKENAERQKTLGGKTISGAALPEGYAAAFVSASKKTSETGPIENKQYLVVGTRGGGKFNPSEVYEYSATASTITLGNKVYTEGTISSFNNMYQVSQFDDVGGPVEGHSIRNADRIVRYFETGPDKGLASVVPFDLDGGWYVRVDSSLKVGNNIAAYDSSGLPKAWNICNVGENNIIEPEPADQCFFYTGQSVSFLDLSAARSRKLIDDSRNAIRQANNQKDLSTVDILGKKMQKGPSVSAFAGTECQEFMSIDDCKLLFNVCDPVICPATRCNFGGKYPVADVIQTGIVGSALLCLPNYKEGIYVPVCLTGIQAGIDSWVSILKNHRDCLQENLDKGTMSGICDQMYSIYLCDFFWKQVGPIANILLPKLIEGAYTGGQGARGGGEYLTVQSAWDNTQKSVDYITQSYAVNSFKAFQAKSITEVGAEVCKMYVSAKGPTALQSLVEPESPPQFHAWFSATSYTSATVPATAQYKVFYHIFAGKAAGTYFSVYLKNPPDSPYYAQMSTLQVTSGFVKQGEYASDTKDFTAPEGYKELCIRINNEEKCGFQQVSSSYAVNALRDSFTADQLKQTGIKSQSECISGSSSLGALLANTNPQAALEEAALPQISNRGIVRVCSTKNPAETTEPGRWQEVGYCDNEAMKCWLDSKSVDNAITANNLGLKNATLTEIKNNVNNQLAGEGRTFAAEDGVAQLKDLRQLAESLKSESLTAADVASATALLQRTESLAPMFVMNNQKAALFLIRAIIINKIYGYQVKAVKTSSTNAQLAAWCIQNGKVVKVETLAESQAIGDCYMAQQEANNALAGAGTGAAERTKWTYDSALTEVDNRLKANPSSLDYMSNRDFIEQLKQDDLLADEQYNQLKSGQKNIAELRIWIPQNKLAAQRQTSESPAPAAVSSSPAGISQEITFVFNNRNYRMVSNPGQPEKNGFLYYLVYFDNEIMDVVVEVNPRATGADGIISKTYTYDFTEPTNIAAGGQIYLLGTPLKEKMQTELINVFVKTAQVLTLEQDPTSNDKVRIMAGSQFTGLTLEKKQPIDAAGTYAGATHLVWTAKGEMGTSGIPLAKVLNNKIIFDFDKASTLPKIKQVQDLQPLITNNVALASALGVSQSEVAGKIYDLLNGATISGLNVNSQVAIFASTYSTSGTITSAAASGSGASVEVEPETAVLSLGAPILFPTKSVTFSNPPTIQQVAAYFDVYDNFVTVFPNSAYKTVSTLALYIYAFAGVKYGMVDVYATKQNGIVTSCTMRGSTTGLDVELIQIVLEEVDISPSDKVISPHEVKAYWDKICADA